MEIRDGFAGTIGNTPLIRLRKLSEETGCEILGKAEFLNPGGSVKDRAALFIIDAAERSGALKPGGTVVEGTAGNTGIGLAHLCAARGYRCIIVIPDNQSQEKMDLLRVLGAEVRPVPPKPYVDPDNYQKIAGRLAQATPNAIWANQFDNVVNRQAHYETTGPEIWRDTGGKLDIFVSGVGTGGTVTGVGQALKPRLPGLKIVAVEPEASPVLSGGTHSPHPIQGIGAGIIPDILDRKVLDEIFKVSNEAALKMAKDMATLEGIPIGISGGAAVAAAIDVGKRNPGKRIVVIIPDFAERYLSTVLFEGLD